MILVTGGTGFIGSNIVRALAAAGVPLAVCDRHVDDLRLSNIAGARVQEMFGPDSLAAWLDGRRSLDAVIHAFTTMGLGGFSSHDASYGYFDSVAIEMVAVFFMVVAGMNFATHYTVWRYRSWRLYWNSVEWRAYLYLLLFAVAVVFAFLYSQGVYDTPQQTLRYAV